MRPFQAFRFWARRAPLGERVGAGVAIAIVLALIGWLLVPGTGGPGSRELAVSGGTQGTLSTSAEPTPISASGAESAAPPGPAGTIVGSDGDRGVVQGRTGPPATRLDGAPATTIAGTDTQGCVAPSGQAKGITAKEVRVAVVLTEIVGPAANQLFDIPTPAQARADYEAAIAGVNREGGVACRKLVPRYVNANPVDESQMMQVCRDVADADLFAVLDTGSLATRPAVLACFGQRRIPYFGAFYITDTARRQFYPFIYSFYYKEQLYKTTVFALRDLGFFDPGRGFRKLGFIYRDCEREAISAFRRWMAEVVPDAQVVTYNVGCPAAFANEADLLQAVLTFKREGVTHVTTGNMQGDMARFTAHAEQQGFRPKYGLPDEALLSIATGSRAPDPNNIANAIAITLSREAENNTPGMAPTAGTQRCNAYRAAAGLKPVYEVPANAGNSCSQVWMLRGALGAAPELSVTALQLGLQRARSIDFSFPQAPNDFTAPGTTTGGQFWRAAQFMPGCRCWQLATREFRRGY